MITLDTAKKMALATTLYSTATVTTLFGLARNHNLGFEKIIDNSSVFTKVTKLTAFPKASTFTVVKGALPALAVIGLAIAAYDHFYETNEIPAAGEHQDAGSKALEA